jgi:signal transduction histidine kinase
MSETRHPRGATDVLRSWSPDPRTWPALAYLVVGLPVAVVAFTVTVTMTALGLGLLVLFPVGLVVLFANIYLVSALAAVERGRVAVFLGVRLPARPPVARPGTGPLGRARARVFSAGHWKEVAYCLLVLPVATLGYALAVSAWSIALAGVLLPVYAGRLPGDGAISWLDWSPGAEVWGGFGVGMLALQAAPGLTRGLADAQAALARALLAPGDGEVLRARVGALQRSRAGVVDAADDERRRIERDLHDGTQQHLVSLAMSLGMARDKLDSDPDAAKALVARAHQEAKDSIIELRNVIRGVYPAVLTDRGLDAALSALAARSPVPVRLDVDLPGRAGATAEAVAYFVVSEALTNVARHSGARRATVHVERSGDRLKVAIVDDGRGGAVEAGGSGLAGLRSRVLAVDGRFWLTSPPGGGTTIAVEVPCES